MNMHKLSKLCCVTTKFTELQFLPHSSDFEFLESFFSFDKYPKMPWSESMIDSEHFEQPVAMQVLKEEPI